ncbi:MAG: glycosyltransferase [Bacteroidales bacterium]|nr:glycosyltransferase [Bacteroidales bacterium]
MIAFSSLILFFTVSYALLILFLWVGFTRLTIRFSEKKSLSPPYISLVVPFRNEEHHLPELIEALEHQTYPPHLFEILLVDDHSTDGSRAVAEKAAEKLKNLIVLGINETEAGKKAALNTGIGKARGAYILQTDADCRMGAFFIEEYAHAIMRTGADLISGPVTIDSKATSFLQALETLDMLSLTGAGAGSFYYNRPIMCSGANLSFSKTLFHESRKFDPVQKTPSGDDMFLLIAAKKLKKQMVFLKSRKAMVWTSPSVSIKSFMRQRARWGSKTKYYADREIMGIALLVSLTNILLLFAPVMMAVWPGAWKPVIAGFALKTITDFLLLLTVSGFTGQRPLMRFYLPVAVLYYFYFVYIVFTSVAGRLHWKEREYLKPEH